MSPGTDGDIDADGESDTVIETSGDTDISTANTMRERAGESRIKLWVMLRANRLVITGVLAVLLFAAFVLGGTVLYPEAATNLATGDTKGTIFSTMIGAIVTGTTLVVTISQLVISQENGPLGDQHERMSNTLDFRDYVGDLYDEPAPADPSAFLRKTVIESQRRAKALRASVAGNEDDGLRDEVDEFTDSITGNADQVTEQLEGAQFGSFDVVFAALNFNYGWKIFQVERIAHDYADAIDEETAALLAELKMSLSMFGPIREHIKTLYFQWALIDLSQLILYTALPGLLIAGVMVGFFGTGPVPGALLGVPNVVWLVGAAFTVTLVPFLLLVSYIARIVVIAKRTLAIGPLILRDSQR